MTGQNPALTSPRSGSRPSAWLAGRLGIYLSAAIFLVAAMALSATLTHLLTIKALSDRAAAILRVSDTLVERIADLNATARAFLVLRDPVLLREREVAKAKVRRDYDTLRRLTSDNPAQRNQAEDLVRASANRIALFDAMIAAAGPRGTTVIAGEAARLKANKASYQALARIRDSAMADFRRNQQDITDDLQLSLWLALFAGIAAPLCGLTGIYLLHRDREKQQVRELTAELMHVQRTAILGDTAAMLAHEINQPLMAGTNYLSILRRHLAMQAAEPAKPVLERIAQQTQRANAILRRLRRFIEKRESERRPEEPRILVEDALALLATMDRTLTIRTEIAEALPLVLVDRIEMQQVLVNLMRNAIEAMETSSRRQLTLSVCTAGKSTIEVALADSGPGLAPSVAARLFTPFLSTKSNGMGVGLSICHAIISHHGGQIWASANPGGGTIFHFTLPVAEQRAVA